MWYSLKIDYNGSPMIWIELKINVCIGSGIESEIVGWIKSETLSQNTLEIVSWMELETLASKKLTIPMMEIALNKWSVAGQGFDAVIALAGIITEEDMHMSDI